MGHRNKLLHEEGRKEPEGKQNMKDMQEQIVGLWAWQKSKYTVIVNRKNSAAMHACMQACRPGMQPRFMTVTSPLNDELWRIVLALGRLESWVLR